MCWHKERRERFSQKLRVIYVRLWAGKVPKNCPRLKLMVQKFTVSSSAQAPAVISQILSIFRVSCTRHGVGPEERLSESAAPTGTSNSNNYFHSVPRG